VKYAIELSRRAEREFLKLDAASAARIKAAIDNLAEISRPVGVRKLEGRQNDWRIRVGRFRVLYSIDDANKKILIHRVTDRKDVYRG
jgi:mRNA interferase RelE/StbE